MLPPTSQSKDCEITIQCYEALSKKTSAETYNCYDVSTPKSVRPVPEDPETEKRRFEIIRDEYPDFSIEGKVICLTGTFSSGEKSEIEQMIIDRGGIVKTSVSRKIDFLVVGNIGSVKWKHGQYGTKIVQACNIIENGGKIQILKENVLVDYLGGLEK